MPNNKVKSFTLAELLVVMIITAIVVGISFTVLRLVQKQIAVIQKNFDKSSELVLFEQQLWQDFNGMRLTEFDKDNNSLVMKSEIDTVIYIFKDDFILRNGDTLKLKLMVDKVFFRGREIKYGAIDAMAISGEKELPEYSIFVSKKNDVTFFMNQEDGF